MTIQTIKINDVEVVESLANLMNDIIKVLPDISFKPQSMNTWRVVKENHPDGVCDGMFVYHLSDLNNHVGVIGVTNYNHNTATNKVKYGITSLNIQDGRYSYGGEGQFKYSIHSKNIVRIAKKVFKPFTFDQIANKAKQKFENSINGIQNRATWDLRNNTCSDIDVFQEDLMELFYLGHKFKSQRVASMVAYLASNQDNIKKYVGYNPDHYFVLVKDSEVQYRLNSAKGEQPNIVPSKDLLPDDIKGKLFVLDITDKQDFVEDIGLKENDGAYWVIA